MKNNHEIALALDTLQGLFLANLFKNQIKSKDDRDVFLVKGGVAMGLLGSKRETKDIDLAALPHVPASTLANRMKSAIHDTMTCGMLRDIHVKYPAQSESDSPKWNISGQLASGTKIALTIEVSRRDLMPEEGISRFVVAENRERGVPSFVARTYSPMAIAASKTAAMLDPNRNKPRDMYDLYMLMEMKVTPPIAMLACLGAEEIKRMLNAVWSKVELMDYDAFRTNVLPHIPELMAKRFDEDFFEEFRIKVGEGVQGWLQEAADIAEGAVPRKDMANQYEKIKARPRARIF